jgi:hypothetical protein
MKDFNLVPPSDPASERQDALMVQLRHAIEEKSKRIQPPEAVPKLKSRPEAKDLAVYFDDLPVDQKTAVLMDFGRAWSPFILVADSSVPESIIGVLFFLLGGWSSVALVFSILGGVLAVFFLVVRSGYSSSLAPLLVLFGFISLAFGMVGTIALVRFARLIHDKEVQIYESIFGPESEPEEKLVSEPAQ